MQRHAHLGGVNRNHWDNTTKAITKGIAIATAVRQAPVQEQGGSGDQAHGLGPFWVRSGGRRP